MKAKRYIVYLENSEGESERYYLLAKNEREAQNNALKSANDLAEIHSDSTWSYRVEEIKSKHLSIQSSMFMQNN